MFSATASSFSNLISGFLLSLSRREIKKAFLVDEGRLPQPSRYAGALNKGVRYY